MSPYLLLLPAAICCLGFIWQASEAAHEWATLPARIAPSYAGLPQALALSLVCFLATVVALVPVFAHALATGGAR
jgi:hypothetical protein